MSGRGKDQAKRKVSYSKLTPELLETVLTSPLSGRKLSELIPLSAPYINDLRARHGYRPLSPAYYKSKAEREAMLPPETEKDKAFRLFTGVR